MQRKSYAHRYPLRAKLQSAIAVVALLYLGLQILFQILPPITVTIGTPALAGDGIQRGSGRYEN